MTKPPEAVPLTLAEAERQCLAAYTADPISPEAAVAAELKRLRPTATRLSEADLLRAAEERAAHNIEMRRLAAAAERNIARARAQPPQTKTPEMKERSNG
jgi:hypothetical protein